MSTTDVESIESELAVASIMHELATYRARRRVETALRVGRMGLLRSGSGALPLEYSTVVTIISVAEGFFASTLRTKVEDAFDTTFLLMRDMRRNSAKTMDTNWDDRLKNAKRWFAMDHTAEDSVQSMLAFVEARNTVVHGLGMLTRRQLSDGGETVTEQLQKVEIRVEGNLIEIDRPAVERCAATSVAAIRWLDRENRTKSLALATP